ncbi:Cellulose-binding domain, fungal [Phytophthora cactorum]|nr:Cellulose-binding domain, fungal [Phytophthora cactorum]
MTKLRVIVGLAVMVAADNVKAQHLRISDDGRMLAETAAEAAVLDSFSSTDADSLSDDRWGADDTVDSGSDLDTLDDIFGTSSSSMEPTTASYTTPQPNTTEPNSDKTTEEPTSTTTAPSSDASASETPADVPTTDAPTSDATATPNATTDAPAVTEEPTTTEMPSTPAHSTSTTVPSQLTGVEAWEQCGGLSFDYTKYFADGLSPNWPAKLSCVPGYSCEEVNPWYFQCQQVKDLTGVELWGQCGGANYNGLTSCTTGSVCKFRK